MNRSVYVLRAGVVGAVFAAMGAVSSASATPYVVDAFSNSSSGGVGKSTISLNIGQAFTSSVALTDLWNAGALPRWSNADGLIADLYATGSDDSGQANGTHIGTIFPLWTQNSLTAPYGSLVGEIGGVFQELGTSFAGNAWATGTLNLYYWDSNNGDNSQYITVDVAARQAGGQAPEPATLAFLGTGLLGLTRFRRRKAAA